MVYGGKPSRGCLTCRARKVKCDEGKPTCKNCAKSKRECAGYKTEFDFVHRNENKNLKKRMARLGVDVDAPGPPPPPPPPPAYQLAGQSTFTLTRRPSPSVSSQRSSISSASGHNSLPSSSLLSPTAILHHNTPPSSLPVPITTQATCYFASNFILTSNLPVGNHPDSGFLAYVAPLISSAPPGSALRHTFDACALAALGNRRRQKSVVQLSLVEHTTALGRVGAALSQPGAHKDDSTLAAILLLSLYETITATREVRMYAWRTHVGAAVGLVKDRRAEWLATPVGRELFRAVRYHLVSRSLSSGLAPEMGAEFWTSEDDPNGLMAGCHRICLKTGEIRAEVTRVMGSVGGNKTGGSVEMMLGLARTVQAFDREIAEWLGEAPERTGVRLETLCWIGEDGEIEDLDASPTSSWGRDETPDEDGPVDWRAKEAFKGRVDVYPDVLTAWCWNCARVARLILGSVNIRLAAWLCSPTEYRLTAEYATSKQICEGTITEVIASIPYHLGWHLRKHSPSRPRGRGRDGNGGEGEREEERTNGYEGFACGETGPLKALPAFFAIWPLACVRNHDITNEEQREWCRGRLRFIADELGLGYADLLYQAEIRFPSMLIRQDGMANGRDIANLPDQPKMKPPPPLAGVGANFASSPRGG